MAISFQIKKSRYFGLDNTNVGIDFSEVNIDIMSFFRTAIFRIKIKSYQLDNVNIH